MTTKVRMTRRIMTVMMLRGNDFNKDDNDVDDDKDKDNSRNDDDDDDDGT